MENKEQQIGQMVDAILADYNLGRQIDNPDIFNNPDQEIVVDIVRKLRRILFPGYFKDRTYRIYNARHNLSMLMEDVLFHLNRQVMLIFQNQGETADAAQEHAWEVCMAFFREIPRVRGLLELDVQAAYEGDPAAYSMDEIIFSYPGLYAITVYRLANVLYRMQVPMLPRMMTEHAHSITGIDIHPGATIGKYFFIDHGTGIVIGETTVIGDRVKIYQGVTLGGLSTRGGQDLRGKKRHPTIEDNVTIYANAAILGGETVIGHDCVIGASSFITASVPCCTTVRMKSPDLQLQQRKCPGCNQ